MNTFSKYYLRFLKFTLAAIVILGVLALSSVIISMLFGKPIGDDYGAITSHSMGSWLHEAYASLKTTGRYGQSIASSLLYGFFGKNIAVILPLITLAWFLLLCFIYTRTLLVLIYKHSQYTNLAAAGLTVSFAFLALFVNDAPNSGNDTVLVSYQLFFWSSGIITYTIPLLILLTGAYILFLSKHSNNLSRRTQLVCYAVTVLITSLFNETQPAIIVAISTLAIVASTLKPYSHLKKYKNILLINILTPILGLLILFFSPGRSQRTKLLENSNTAADGSVIDATIRNLQTLFQQYYFKLDDLILMISASVLVAVVIYHTSKDKKQLVIYSRRVLKYLPVITIVGLLSATVSVLLVVIGYGHSAGIYPRTILITQLLYVVTIPLITVASSTLLLFKYKEGVFLKCAVIFISICLFLSFPSQITKIRTQINSSVKYYNSWIIQDSILSKSSQNNVRETIYLESSNPGIGDGFNLTCTGPYAHSTMWLNVQITQYYGSQDRVCLLSDKRMDQEANEKWISE